MALPCSALTDRMHSRQGFQGEWLWSGTSDMSALLSVPAALYVVNGIGREKWLLHNAKLLKEAAALLHKAFGSENVLGESPLAPEARNSAHLDPTSQGHSLAKGWQRCRRMHLYKQLVMVEWPMDSCHDGANVMGFSKAAFQIVMHAQARMGSTHAWQL